jgi:hypothetical protein
MILNLLVLVPFAFVSFFGGFRRPVGVPCGERILNELGAVVGEESE